MMTRKEMLSGSIHILKWLLAGIIIPLLAALIGVEEFRSGFLTLFGVKQHPAPPLPHEEITDKDRDVTERFKKLADEYSTDSK